MKAGVVALLELALVGCATMPTDVSLLEDSAIPSLSVIKDEFDGSAIVQQVPVSSSSSLAEGWHALGFEWHQKTPEIIFVTAGTIGSVTLTHLAFNSDGELLTDQAGERWHRVRLIVHAPVRDVVAGLLENR